MVIIEQIIMNKVRSTKLLLPMVIIEQIIMNKVRSTKLLLPIFDPVKNQEKKEKE
jgi:hypothetical protein